MMKMDGLDVVAVLLTLALLLVGCSKEEPPDKEPAWNYVRSPLSGRCYEIVHQRQRTSSYYGGNNFVTVMAMNEVPCWEMERYYKQQHKGG